MALTPAAAHHIYIPLARLACRGPRWGKNARASRRPNRDEARDQIHPGALSSKQYHRSWPPPPFGDADAWPKSFTPQAPFAEITWRVMLSPLAIVTVCDCDVSMLELPRAQGLAVSMPRPAAPSQQTWSEQSLIAALTGPRRRSAHASYATSSKPAYFASWRACVRDFLSPASMSEAASWRRRPTLARKRSLGNSLPMAAHSSVVKQSPFAARGDSDLPSHPGRPVPNSITHAWAAAA